MSFRFQYDRVNNTLLARLEGEVADDLVLELRTATHKRVVEQAPGAYTADCSGATKFLGSSDFVRHMAKLGTPPGPTPLSFIVAPSKVGYGLARMYQIVGEAKPSRVNRDAVAGRGVRIPRNRLVTVRAPRVTFHPVVPQP